MLSGAKRNRNISDFSERLGFLASLGMTLGICEIFNAQVLSNQARTIRLPIHVIEKLNQIKRAQRELSQALGRKPTEAEIAARLELKPESLRQILSMARTAQTDSLDRVIGKDEDSELSEILEDKQSARPDEIVDLGLLRQELQVSLAKLPGNQRRVIALRYGLHDGVRRSLNQVGEEMGLSYERIRQLERSTMTRLRRAFRRNWGDRFR